MRYDTYLFILKNKNRLLFDNATGAGSDTTVDATASSIDPNNYLAPLAGKRIRNMLIVVLIIVAIIYLIKKII